jgi:hypothetical protein
MYVLLRELRSQEQIATERLRGKSVRECSNAAARALGIVRDFSRIEIFGRPRVCTTPQCREYDTLARKIQIVACRKLAENAAKTGLNWGHCATVQGFTVQKAALMDESFESCGVETNSGPFWPSVS